MNLFHEILQLNEIVAKGTKLQNNIRISLNQAAV